MNIESIIDKKFRGCVSISQNNNILFERAYGYADLANEIPNTLETKFATASAGKVFVAVGILQLIEKCLLQFSDKLENMFDFDLQKIDPNITVEQLLTHISGIPDYFDESLMDDYEELWTHFPNYKIRTNTDLLPLFINKAMMYKRGEKFQYNNTGYVVLAMIIEKIANTPFDTYLNTNIFNPSDMQNTGYFELDRLPSKCANNYIWDNRHNSYRTNIYSVDAKGTGAGGAFTTLNDILKFWNNLLNYELLNNNMTETMMSFQSGNYFEKGDSQYGYGIWLNDNDNYPYTPYFQGCDPGVSFISGFDPKTKTISTVVSNYGDNVWEVMRNLREYFRGH